MLSVDAVVSEMANPLMCGQVNPDDASKGIEALKAALTDAGMDTIIAEVQTQYDAWKAAQGK